MRRIVPVLLVSALAFAACGGDDAGDGRGEPQGATTTRGDGRLGGKVVLMTHDSFAVSDETLEAFTDETGVEVEVLRSGDAGSMLSQAILTKGDPLADVLYGVDNTFLTRALDEDVFVPYEAAGLDSVPDDLRLDLEHRVTPIDFGDVCLNYDLGWFEERGVDPPSSLDDLTDPALKGLTVVENPATSSPGLAFLLGTVAEFGEDDWADYWQELRDNDVLAVAGWEEAYYGEFTVGGGGDRPIVVSYASSPAADVVFADPPKAEPATGVVDDSCFRQIEFAGVLRNAEHEAAAQALVDFMLSERFQEDIPLQMFVYPANADAALPEVFTEHAVVPDEPLELPASTIAEHRDEWVDEWTNVVLR